MKTETNKLQVAIGMGVAVFVVMFGLVFLNPLQAVEWRISDLFFKPVGVSDQVTIIAIDDKSIDATTGLGRFRDWPRTYYAQLLSTLSTYTPKVVGLDLDFRQGSKGISDIRLGQILDTIAKNLAAGYETSGSSLYELLKKFKSDSHPDDADFAAVLDKSTVPVVLISLLTSSEQVKEGTSDIPKVSGILTPIFNTSPKVSTGYANILYDRDGVVRRFLPKVDTYKSFATQIAETFLGSEIPSLARGKQIPIDFTARPLSYKMISFADIMSGNFKPEDINGKVILIGTTAPILQDAHPTPTSRLAMPGVEINAQMVAQLINGVSIYEQGFVGVSVVLFVVALFASIVFFRFALRYVAGIFVLGLVLIPAIVYVLHLKGIYVYVVYPVITWVLCMVTVSWYRSRTEFREKKEIERAFSHYVSPVIVRELAKDPSSLRLGGKRQVISVMFSDIVNFTSMAEKLTPEDTVAVLNDYLTAMTDVIFGYNGTLDKYQGDAIMALFGAPLEDPHHALNACHTALNMRRALSALHEKWGQIPDLPFKEDLVQLDFRVGIATGPAILGNVGSEKRFDYTAIGDIVNLGSRLESINRKYGTRVLVDKETFTQITQNHNPFTFRKLDLVRVKGKKQETEIFELVAQNEHVTNEMKMMLDDFENGRILYVQRNFAEAKQYFDSALSRMPEDAPSRIYANRCAFFIRKPPNRDWDPIVNLEEK